MLCSTQVGLSANVGKHRYCPLKAGLTVGRLRTCVIELVRIGLSYKKT